MVAVMKADESSATGTAFTSVDVYSASEGMTTLGELTHVPGYVALTFSQASADNDTILGMIRNPFTNDGVVKWTAADRQLYNRTDSYPSGDAITPERKQIQENTLNFVASISALPGEIAHPFYETTATIVEGTGWPTDANGWVAVQERTDTNAGNTRVPGNSDYMTTAIGWTKNNDNQNTLISEISTAHLGLNDYVSGSNGPAFTFDISGDVTGLSNIGKTVSSVAATYLPQDFKQ